MAATLIGHQRNLLGLFSTVQVREWHMAYPHPPHFCRFGEHPSVLDFDLPTPLGLSISFPTALSNELRIITNSPQCFPFPPSLLSPLHSVSFGSTRSASILLHLPPSVCHPTNPSPSPSLPPPEAARIRSRSRPLCSTTLPHLPTRWGLDYAGQHRSVHTLKNSSRHPIQRRDGGGSSRRADATAFGDNGACAAAHSQHPED